MQMLIDTHLADKLICKHVLSKTCRQYWACRQQDLEQLTRALVEGGQADRAVAKYVFSKDQKNTAFFAGERELKQVLLKRYLKPERGIGIVVIPSLAFTDDTRTPESQARNVLANGTLVHTKSLGQLEIVSLGGIGHTGIVYVARSFTDPNKRYALKVVIRYEPERVISMQREKKKMDYLKSLGVAHPKLLEDGDDYCIKEWVEGMTGLAWFDEWVKNGHPISDEAFRSLVDLFFLSLAIIPLRQ